MKLKDFKNELIEKLPSSHDMDRRKWAYEIVQYDFDLNELKNLLFEDTKVASRFAWLLSDICEEDKTKVEGILEEIFNRRNEVNAINFERTLAKLFYNIKIPVSIEGEVFEALSQWFMNPQLNVSTKRYCLLAMFELTKKYKDLSIELKEMIEDQKDLHSDSFKKLALKVLEKIEHFE